MKYKTFLDSHNRPRISVSPQEIGPIEALFTGGIAASTADALATLQALRDLKSGAIAHFERGGNYWTMVAEPNRVDIYTEDDDRVGQMELSALEELLESWVALISDGRTTEAEMPHRSPLPEAPSAPLLHYQYRVDRSADTVATGELLRTTPLRVGDRLVIGRFSGIVRSIEPLIDQRVFRLGIEVQCPRSKAPTPR